MMLGDVDYGGGYAFGRRRDIWEISVTSTQYCCEPKTVLKNKLIKKTNSKKIHQNIAMKSTPIIPILQALFYMKQTASEESSYLFWIHL